MRKTISVDALKVGMFLAEPAHDQNGDLLLAANITLRSEKQIRRLKEANVLVVSIDSDKGLDCEPGQEVTTEPEADAPTPVTVAEKPRPEVKVVEEKLPTAPPPKAPPVKAVPFSEEVQRADKIKEETTKIVRSMFEDARSGRSLRAQDAKDAVTEMIGSVFRNQLALLSLTKIKEYDEYTFNHSINVCTLCLAQARNMGLNHRQLEEIGIGVLLHDVGKMRVSPHIMNKPGRLTDQEFIEMKQHPVFSFEILRGIGLPDSALSVPAQHHERHDGSGYPQGLKGDEIHLYAQIAGINNVYDAMTSRRIYRSALLPHLAMAQIFKEKDNHFSTKMVMSFISSLGVFPIGSMVRLSSDEVGIVISVNEKELTRPRVSIIFSRRGTMKRQPIVTDLAEERSKEIVTTLDPRAWKIRIEDFIYSSTD